MFRSNSAIFRLEIQCQRKSYLSDLNSGVQGRGRDLVYKYGVSGWNGVGTSVCPLGEFICWSVSLRGWFLRHGGPVSEVVVLRWSLYVGCCGGSTPLLGDQVGACVSPSDFIRQRKTVARTSLHFLLDNLLLVIFNREIYKILKRISRKESQCKLCRSIYN